MRQKELCVDCMYWRIMMLSSKLLNNVLSKFSIQPNTKCNFTSNSSQWSWLTLSILFFKKLCQSISFSRIHQLPRYYISILVWFQIIFLNTKSNNFSKYAVKCFYLIYTIEFQFVHFNRNTIQHILFQSICIME